MPGQCQPVGRGCTGVHHVEEHSLPFAYLDRIAKSEHAVIDRRIVIKGIHGSIPAASHIRIPVVQCEEYFLIVRTWRLFRLNVETPELTGISAPLQIVPRKGVRVVPTKTRRPRRKTVAPLSACRDHRRALFHGAVFARWNPQSMPVHNLRRVRIVHNINRDWLAFRPANQRPGNAPVVRNRLNYLFGRNLQLERRNLKPHVRRRLGPQLCLRGCAQQREACSDQKTTAIQWHVCSIEGSWNCPPDDASNRTVVREYPSQSDDRYWPLPQ